MIKEVVIFSLLVVAFSNVAAANTAPKIENLPSEIFACEGSQLSQTFDIFDDNVETMMVDISPKELFFVRKAGSRKGEIFSRVLGKNSSEKDFVRDVYLSDGAFSDTREVLIRVVPVNSPPAISDTRVQTVFLSENPEFSLEILANDSEDEELEFNLDFRGGEKIFDVNEFGAVSSILGTAQEGVYEIAACVRDSGLEISDGSEFCGEDGEPKRTCDLFQLTVVETNHPPTIISSSPVEKKINVSGGEVLAFSSSAFDSDGTSPDTYWYVDGEVASFVSGLNSTETEFQHEFPCGRLSFHEVKLEIRDGLARDSLTWDVKVQSGNESCVVEVEGDDCEPLWACSEWNPCQHAAQSVQFGSLPTESFEKISLACAENSLSEESCGFQIRSCNDLNFCNSTEKPEELRSCHFTINPSCSDGIRNCHDGLCEVFSDCGGPCGACATCTDGKKNQEEGGVDCGGPCGNKCPKEDEIAMRLYLTIASVVAVLILLVIATIKIYRVAKMRRQLEVMGQ